MIEYDFGKWGVGFVWRISGSVFPKALVWGLPNAFLAWGLKNLVFMYPRYFKALFGELHGGAFTNMWGGYTMVLGFLLVFRTQIAYSRFWEGCTLLQAVKGVWFNATSNLVAFSSDEASKKRDVLVFHHLLVRLMSMLFCTALQQVCDMHDENFQILGEDGISQENLDYLYESHDKCEVILQWVQKLIVLNHHSGVIPIAPPILSRVFQELSNGIVDVQNARKICEFPFPFPYAQSISFFLMIHFLVTPVIIALLIDSPIAGAAVSFSVVFAYWSVNYIAAEIEMPFGDDPNDMPTTLLQDNFNRELRMLLDPMAQQAPKFDYDESHHSLVVPRKTKFLCEGYTRQSHEKRRSLKRNSVTTNTSSSSTNSNDFVNYGAPGAISSNKSNLNLVEDAPSLSSPKKAHFADEILAKPVEDIVVHASDAQAKQKKDREHKIANGYWDAHPDVDPSMFLKPPDSFKPIMSMKQWEITGIVQEGKSKSKPISGVPFTTNVILAPPTLPYPSFLPQALPSAMCGQDTELVADTLVQYESTRDTLGTGSGSEEVERLRPQGPPPLLKEQTHGSSAGIDCNEEAYGIKSPHVVKILQDDSTNQLGQVESRKVRDAGLRYGDNPPTIRV